MGPRGPVCPPDYGYRPEELNRPPDVSAQTLYVVGGLYGNLEALDVIEAMARQETPEARLVFNGDFNWLNVGPGAFRSVNARVLRHRATRGNVETELARDVSLGHCGCAYPDWVQPGVAERSNRIMQRLLSTARETPAVLRDLAGLPRHMVAEVGRLRVGIVHGDAWSLAGWSFAQESLAGPTPHPELGLAFEAAAVRVFACSHTGLPVLKLVSTRLGPALVANNGAAGLPNFRSARHGLITRISVHGGAPVEALYGTWLDGVRIEALPVYYNLEAWERLFLRSWPPDSAGHEAYWDRLTGGPEYELHEALRLGGPRARAAPSRA